jgi:MFS family permease
MKTRVGGFVPALPRRAWTLLGADAVSALGSGLVMPFLIIYLHAVRHLSIGVASLALSAVAAAGFLGGPVSGLLVDRLGGRLALMAALVISAGGSAWLAFVSAPWEAFGAAAVFGVGIAAFWPAMHSTLASAVSVAQRSSVFSVHYSTLNAGLGVGGVIGGLFVDVQSPGTFQAIFLLDSLTFLIFAAGLLFMPDVGGRVTSTAEEDEPRVGYLKVLADKLFLRVFLLMTLVVTIGYGQLSSIFPAFVTGDGESTTRVVGFAFGANTFLIVGAQLVVLKKMAGRRRTRGMVALAVLWAASWLLTWGAGGVGGGTLAAAGFIAAMALFALGETFMSPSLPPMVNDLAPDRLRGRYNAVYSMSWSIGQVVGPALAGAALAAGLAGPFLGMLAASCGLVVFAALRLERELPRHANLVAEGGEASPKETGPPRETVSAHAP